jgi:hypothetical protein
MCSSVAPREIRVCLALAADVRFGRTGERGLADPVACRPDIGMLETRIGRLFDRLSRSVALSPDGWRLSASRRTPDTLEMK